MAPRGGPDIVRKWRAFRAAPLPTADLAEKKTNATLFVNGTLNKTYQHSISSSKRLVKNINKRPIRV